MTDSNEHARILIAEDQEHVREALAMLLRSRGYSVLLSSSPQEALQSAGQQTIDLALVDMNYRRDSTSGVEGLNLIESLRQMDNTLPVVALTAWGNVDLAVNAMKSGAADFVEKPWRNDSLLEKVELLTRRGRELRSLHRVAEYEKLDAKQVQMRIVPRRHIVAGDVELFGESVPVGTVGGDYFGAWQPSPESLHFCVADVSGKGTPGALIAAMLHASVSSLAESDGGAEKIVDEVEYLLRDQLGGEHYVTLFYGVFDVASRTLEYVNAGHCPPIVLRANNAMELLGSTRRVLGLVRSQAVRAERVSLRPGDCLALYTDGITEASDAAGDEFGTERLMALLSENGVSKLQDLHGRILSGVHSFASGKLTDDATLVLVSVHGAPQTHVESTNDQALSQTQS